MGTRFFSLGKRSCESIPFNSQFCGIQSAYKLLKTDNINNSDAEKSYHSYKSYKRENFSSHSTKATLRKRKFVVENEKNSRSAFSSAVSKLHQELSVLSVDPRDYDSTLSLRGLNTE